MARAPHSHHKQQQLQPPATLHQRWGNKERGRACGMLLLQAASCVVHATRTRVCCICSVVSQDFLCCWWQVFQAPCYEGHTCSGAMQADGDKDMQDAVGDKRSEVGAQLMCVCACLCVSSGCDCHSVTRCGR